MPSSLPLENPGTENGAMAEVKYAAEVPGTNSCKTTAPVFSRTRRQTRLVGLQSKADVVERGSA